MRNSQINVLSKQFLNNSMSFELQQTTATFYVREIFETFLSPLFLMFLFLICLQPTLFRVVIRETATEKEFDIAIQMTLEHVGSDVSENKNG